MTDPYWPIIVVILYFIVVSVGEFLFRKFPEGQSKSWYWMHRIMGIMLFVISLGVLIFVLNLIDIGINIGNFYQRLGTLVGGVIVIVYIAMDVWGKYIKPMNFNNMYAMGLN